MTSFYTISLQDDQTCSSCKGNVKMHVPERIVLCAKYEYETGKELSKIPIANNTIIKAKKPTKEELTIGEEIKHYRNQMAIMNKRIIVLEQEHRSRYQKEKIIYGFGIAYILIKLIIWANRES